MPLGTTAFWAAVIPYDSANILTNPSFERGTAGWGTLQAGTIGTTSAVQTFGAWSGSIAPTSNGTAGAVGPTFTAGNGTLYYFSAYVRGAAGIPYRLAVGDSNGQNFVGSTTLTGGGTWQRYVGSWTEAAGATRRLVLTKNSSADVSAFYIDGAQVEPFLYSTYIDGDQDGCQWGGGPHASTSIRSGQSRAGGSVVALADLGLAPADQLGVGMAPIENSWQSYAIIDGAQYQRTRAKERSFTLTSFIPGASLQNLHALRRQVINALKIDLVDEQQPTRFYYTGAGGTVQIDAFLDGGLEEGQLDGFEETVGVKFIAPDPMWESTWQQGTALGASRSIGSANYIAYRAPSGIWGTLGANGVTLTSGGGASISPIQQIMWAPSGTLWMVGTFTAAGGTAASNMAFYTPQTNNFGTILATTSLIWSAAMLPDESIYIGGTWTLGGGTVGGNNIGYYKPGNTTVGTIVGGTTHTGIVRSLYYSPISGTLFAGGDFLAVAGTTIPRIAAYIPQAGAWGSLTGGTVGDVAGDFVSAVAQAQSGTVYIGGRIGSFGNVAARGIGYWTANGFGSVPLGVAAGGTTVYTLAIAPDQRVYLGGDFGSAGLNAAPAVAVWNGASLQPLGSGFYNAGTSIIRAVKPLPDGRILFGGSFQGTAGGVTMIDNVALWVGNTYVPIDFDMPGTANVNDAVVLPNGTMYLAYKTSGTANAPSVTSVVNYGMANAYPTIKYRNTGTILQTIYETNNATTNDSIFFNRLQILPSEELTLTLTPSARSFTSSFGRSAFGNILAGSNLATWRLLPGTNNVVNFTDGSVLTSIYWTPKHHSADAGTVFP